MGWFSTVVFDRDGLSVARTCGTPGAVNPCENLMISKHHLALPGAGEKSTPYQRPHRPTRQFLIRFRDGFEPFSKRIERHQRRRKCNKTTILSTLRTQARACLWRVTNWAD